MDYDDRTDYRFFIEDDFWGKFKDGNTVLSFWFAPKEPLEKDRAFEVYYSYAPYYHFGNVNYPAGTTKPKFYEFNIDTKNIPNTYKSNTFFIRFKNADLGKTFYLTKGKLEIGDYSLYTPSLSELEPSKQPLLPPEGNYKEIQAL